jgi:hypothetical protein
MDMRVIIYSFSSLVIGFLVSLLFSSFSYIEIPTENKTIYRITNCNNNDFTDIKLLMLDIKKDISNTQLDILKLSQKKYNSISIPEVLPEKQITNDKLNIDASNTTSTNELLKVVDSEKISSITSKFYSGNKSEQRDAIIALSHVGNLAMQTEIVKLITDNSEDMGLRITAIENIDWRYNASELSSIFLNTNDDDIRTSLLEAALKTSFDNNNIDVLSDTFYNTFNNIQDDNIKILTLRFLSNQNNDYAKNIVSSVPIDTFLPENQSIAKEIYGSILGYSKE